MTIHTKVDETSLVDAARFADEIAMRDRPIVLRGQAKRWPAVAAGLRSDEALVDYMKAMDRGRPPKC
jgi:hypothetical protein